MTAAAHSPGPWQQQAGPSATKVVDALGQLVATISPGPAKRANAAAVTVAPELLQCARAAAPWLRRMLTDFRAALSRADLVVLEQLVSQHEAVVSAAGSDVAANTTPRRVLVEMAANSDRQLIWASLRVLRTTTTTELATVTELPEQSIRVYLGLLAKAGYLRCHARSGPGQPVPRMLVRNSGPKAPRCGKAGVFDPNTGITYDHAGKVIASPINRHGKRKARPLPTTIAPQKAVAP